MPWFSSRAKAIRSFLDIAPGGLVDLHAHLLPGLDDGPGDLSESATMLDRLGGLGYAAVTSTPHFNARTRTPEIGAHQAIAASLRQIRGEKGPSLHLGAEIGFDDLFFDEERERRLPGIGGARCYLVEFGLGPGSIPRRLEEAAFREQVRGVRLVLAHPERYPDLQRDPKRLETLGRSGLYLQVDLLSLTGKHGRRSRATALALLDDRLADLVATDLHRARELADLGRALAILAERDAGEFARLTARNPRALLEGRPDAMMRHV